MKHGLHNWPEGMDLKRLILSLYGKISPRKQRLAAVAFCRRVARRMPDACCRQALVVAEGYADRAVSREELAAAHRDVEEFCDAESAYSGGFGSKVTSRFAAQAAFWATHPTKRHFLDRAANAAAVAVTDVLNWGVTYSRECAGQLPLLRDILGPDRPPKVSRLWLAWNDGIIPKLAQALYEERKLPEGTLDPTRLAVLADALEEAGCDHADILSHCRGEGPHVRGCWVVDLLLGKK